LAINRHGAKTGDQLATGWFVGQPEVIHFIRHAARRRRFFRCSLAASNSGTGLFLVHFYEAILYIAILVMLFYMEDRWAYLIGILASVAWLSLAYVSGIFGGS
jgi:hypothetical protein